MTAALEITNLTAGYGSLPVVRGAGLSVGEGEVVALLGANGAGKTTTLLTTAGVLAPMGGDVRLFGRSIGGQRAHRIARAGLTLVPDDRGVFAGLTVRENLRLARGENMEGVLDLFPALRPLRGRRCGVLSGGEQQMLALAKALLGAPRVLLFDELSLGLAPVIVERLLPLIRQIAQDRGIAVLLVEQHTAMALGVADRVYVMRRGEIVLEGDTATLRERRDLLEASYLGDQLAIGGAA